MGPVTLPKATNCHAEAQGCAVEPDPGGGRPDGRAASDGRRGAQDAKDARANLASLTFDEVDEAVETLTPAPMFTGIVEVES